MGLVYFLKARFLPYDECKFPSKRNPPITNTLYRPIDISGELQEQHGFRQVMMTPHRWLSAADVTGHSRV